MKIFKNILAFSLFLTVAPLSFSASERLNNVTPTFTIVDGGGLYVKFSRRPSTCSGEYKGVHAVIPQTSKNFNDSMLKVLRAKASSKPITIVFEDEGNCTNEESLMVILEVK